MGCKTCLVERGKDWPEEMFECVRGVGRREWGTHVCVCTVCAVCSVCVLCVACQKELGCLIRVDRRKGERTKGRERKDNLLAVRVREFDKRRSEVVIWNSRSGLWEIDRWKSEGQQQSGAISLPARPVAHESEIKIEGEDRMGELVRGEMAGIVKGWQGNPPLKVACYIHYKIENQVSNGLTWCIHP